MDFRATPIVRLPDAASIVLLPGIVYAGPAHQQQTLDMVNAAAHHQPGAKAWMINYCTERPAAREDVRDGIERIWSFAHLIVGDDKQLRFTGRRFKLVELPPKSEEEEENDTKIAKKIKLGEHTLDILKTEPVSQEQSKAIQEQIAKAQREAALNQSSFGGVPLEQRPVLKRKEREEGKANLCGDDDEKLVVAPREEQPVKDLEEPAQNVNL